MVGVTGPVLVYSLNAWLPELMLRAGFNADGSLSFLLVLNGGAILGAVACSRVADRLGLKPVFAGASAPPQRKNPAPVIRRHPPCSILLARPPQASRGE